MADVVTGTIIDLFELLIGNDDARAEFEADPSGFLDEHGFGDLSCDDLTAVLPFVHESISNQVSQGADVTFPHQSVRHDDEDEHDAVARTIKEVVHFTEINNITNIVNDNDLAVNNNVFAEGNVDIDNDFNVANGDGAVVVDGNNSGNIASGERSVAGDNNDVVGDDSDNAFNQGSIVNGDQTATDGGVIANAGRDATGSSQDNDQDNDTTTTVLSDNDTTTTTLNDIDTTTLSDNDTTTLSDNDTLTVTEIDTTVVGESGPGSVDVD